jgi:hypothetical protein
MYLFLAAIAFFAVLAVIGVFNYRSDRDGKWHHPVRSTDLRWRRYSNGKWEYRDMTPDEVAKWQDINAW